MVRDTRSKPSNVVKSRSAPSLLGGFASPRTSEHLPSNRFIELGDIALGNSRRHSVNFAIDLDAGETADEKAELSEPPRPAEAVAPLKPPRLSLPKQSPPKPPKQLASSPLTRPKPPRPPSARPQLPLPPKARVPKPPKIDRPRPFTPGINTPTRRPR